MSKLTDIAGLDARLEAVLIGLDHWLDALEGVDRTAAQLRWRLDVITLAAANLRGRDASRLMIAFFESISTEVESLMKRFPDSEDYLATVVRSFMG